MPRSVLVRVVFGVLVLATFAAFLVAQRLKRSTPIVQKVHYYGFLSPRSVKGKRSVRIYFSLPKGGRVTATMVNAAGDDVRTLVDRRLVKGPHQYVWKGRTDAGLIAPDGDYRLRVTLLDEGRSLTVVHAVKLDTTPPHPRIATVTPSEILPGAPAPLGRARIRWRGESAYPTLIQIYRTDLPKPQLVTAFEQYRGRHSALWDGKVAGVPAADGVYSVTVTTYDRAGNAGSFPRRLPPARGESTRNTGVSVRYLTVSAPLVPVAAGSVTHFKIGPVARRMRWSLGPTGIGAPLARGSAKTRNLAVRVPSNAHTGLYLLRVQAAGHRAVQPVAVQGAPRRAKVLVVLPAITWQGNNPVDNDDDGLPDTLPAGDSVPITRAFAGGRPPAGLMGGVAPLLRFLARERVPYEITTDLALAQRQGAGLAGHSGVIFAGDETWLTSKLDLALRTYVENGGKVASFGTDSFRRRVRLGTDVLADPDQPERFNVFGEQTAPLHIAQAPMAVNQPDGLNLFGGTDGFLGAFTDFEQSQRLVGGTQVLSSAGRDPNHPSFVAYRLGKGVVVRTGAPAWNADLAGDVELTDVTRRIWSLLSR